jgi:hypothetical protein
MSGQFAVGDHAQLNQWNQAADDPLARLDRAIQELTAAAASELGPEQAEQVRDDGGRLIDEARRQRPDRDMVSLLLKRLTARVGSVAALLEGVDRIKDLIIPLLH